uniref:Uncharacterized protein n=1 Tax=Moniliophthora roreri TaxID=221103 RepID=A0A0W0FIR8_MONRR
MLLLSLTMQVHYQMSISLKSLRTNLQGLKGGRVT